MNQAKNKAEDDDPTKKNADFRVEKTIVVINQKIYKRESDNNNRRKDYWQFLMVGKLHGVADPAGRFKATGYDTS